MVLGYQNITHESSAEDRIIAMSSEKREAIESDPCFSIFQAIEEHGELDFQNLHLAVSMLLGSASAKTKNLVLFTSDRRKEAEQFVLDNPTYDLIHTTPMGYFLEKLELFSARSWGKVGKEYAYTAWNAAAVKLIQETQSEDITIIANTDNQKSTLWMLEMVLLEKMKKARQFHLKDSAKFEGFKTLDRDGISGYMNPQLAEWAEHLSDYLHDENNKDFYDLLVSHPIGKKYVGMTILSEYELAQMRMQHLETLSSIAPHLEL